MMYKREVMKVLELPPGPPVKPAEEVGQSTNTLFLLRKGIRLRYSTIACLTLNPDIDFYVVTHGQDDFLKTHESNLDCAVAAANSAVLESRWCWE